MRPKSPQSRRRNAVVWYGQILIIEGTRHTHRSADVCERPHHVFLPIGRPSAGRAVSRPRDARFRRDDTGRGDGDEPVPFDKIKIDRSFVHDLQNADSQAIIRAVTGLGASLGMATTGEGVETREEVEYLRREGCTEAQGFFFSKARPAGEIYRMLAEHTAAISAVA